MTDELPTATLGHLVALQSAKIAGKKDITRPYVGLEHLASGEPEIVGTLPSSESVSVNSVFEVDDILFGKLRPNLRKCVAAPFAGYCSTDILVLRARAGVNPRFAAHVLQSDGVFAAAVRSATGTKMPRTNWAALEALRVFAPAQEEEQKRIADILDATDQAIRGSTDLVTKLQRLKAGLVHDLLKRGLDESGELRDPVRHPTEFQDSVLGRVPKAWEITVVERVGEVTLGRQRSPRHEHGSNLMPYLRVANVFDGWIDYSDVLRMNFTPAEQKTFSLVPGDILLNEGQSLELVGRSAVFRGAPYSHCFQNTLIRFRCFPGSIPEFCQAVFKYWLDTWRFAGVARQTTSVAHLGADRFAKMAFARPKRDEQERIAECLSTTDRRIEAEEHRLAKLRCIRQGLANDLLTGQVRVENYQSAYANVGDS